MASVNPIVVKEFRQAVRSRLVIVILTLFLLVNLGVIGGYLCNVARSGHQHYGRATGFLVSGVRFVCHLPGLRAAVRRHSAVVGA